MGWSVKIARIAGIDVKIHVTFFMLLVWIGLGHLIEGGWNAAVQGVALIVSLFACVLLHEFGHALTARRFGISTVDITLLPIGGVAQLQRMPEKPAQEIIVALAGPAVNVVIACALFFILGHTGEQARIEALASTNFGLLPKLAVINVWLALFNLLPAFPMDGGRILRAVLALFLRYSTATRVAAAIGQGMAFLFGLAGLFGNPMLLFVALFIYLAGVQETLAVLIREFTQRFSVRDAMITGFTVIDARSSLQEAIDILLRSGQHDFPVADDDGAYVGLLTRDRLIAGYRSRRTDAPVSEVMECNIPTIRADAPLDRALQKLRDCSGLVAVNSEGRVVGLVTPESIGELMMIHADFPARTSGPVRRPAPAGTETPRNMLERTLS